MTSQSDSRLGTMTSHEWITPEEHLQVKNLANDHELAEEPVLSVRVYGQHRDEHRHDSRVD